MSTTRNLVFIGDSLTAWFDWQKRFPAYTVTNLGIPGETVEGLLDRLDGIRARIGNPDVIFLMTGINNIAMEQFDITDPFREIVSDLATSYTKSTVVVQSILPTELVWIGDNIIRDTNRRFEQIAREYGAEFLDVYSLFVDSKRAPKNGYLQEDGVHLSSKGYEVWANEVERFLKAVR